MLCKFTKFKLLLDSPQVKRDLISTMKTYFPEVHHEFLNDIRLRNLENQEILTKSQILARTQPSAQYLLHKQIFDTTGQKLRKEDVRDFWPCSILYNSFTFRNIFCRISSRKHIFHS